MSLNFNAVFIIFVVIFFIICALLLVVAIKHFILVLIFLDLLLLANIMLFIGIGTLIGFEIVALGYNYALLILAVAAADTAVGLGLCILYYKATGRVEID